MPCLIQVLYFPASTVGIDDKLDFGHGASNPSFARGRVNQRDRFLPVKYSKHNRQDERSDNFENIGVVCVSGGCNVTKPSDGSTDKAAADVIVKVETRVNLSENRTKQEVGETPDIPVVMGYGGTQLENSGADGTVTPNYKAIYSPNPNTVHIPTFNPVFPNNRRASYMPSSFVPIFNHYPSHSMADFPRNYHTYQGSGSNNNAPTITTNSFSSVEPNLINIKTIPIFGNNEVKSADYSKNMVGVIVPYFEPSHHSHYYGENPPQYIHYPKQNSFYNPVEFKTVRTTWSPSLLYNNIPHNLYSATEDNDVKCTCQKGAGMTWSPNHNRKHFNVNPVAQVDDKLAPLE